MKLIESETTSETAPLDVNVDRRLFEPGSTAHVEVDVGDHHMLAICAVIRIQNGQVFADLHQEEFGRAAYFHFQT
jgi:hypothetical protein